jgi:hypothetical protein
MNTLTRRANLIYKDWVLVESEFDPAKLRTRETVFTIGNGYVRLIFVVGDINLASESRT